MLMMMMMSVALVMMSVDGTENDNDSDDNYWRANRQKDRQPAQQTLGHITRSYKDK